MPTITVSYESEAERVALQRAIDYAVEMLRVAQAAPDDRVVDACEGLALGQGRKLLRDSLGDAIQARLDAAEEKGRRASPAVTPGPTRADAAARS